MQLALFDQSWDRTQFCLTPSPGPFYLTVSRVRHGNAVMNEDKTVFEASPLGQQVDTSPDGIRHEELP